MNILPIVLTCDNNYFKYASVVIASLIENANSKYQYEINILSEYISPENKIKAKSQIRQVSNFVLNFITLDNFDASKFFLNSYMTVSTYYRFYILDIFKHYERILYLDCDLVVDADISELAHMEFEDRLALCCTSSYVYNKITSGGDELFSVDYLKNTLKMDNPKEYFNAGMMVYNIKKMNEIGLSEIFFKAIDEIKNPILQDQDILNSVLYRWGGVKIISDKYNMTKQFKITTKRILFDTLKRCLGIVNKSKKWYYIYHYVGEMKPWKKIDVDSKLFYYYAKKSPFYKDILNKN